MAEAGPAPLVTASAIEKTYRVGRDEVTALAGVSLTVEDGEFLAIVGPSGSGKTTLLNILGLIESPSSGTLEIDSRSVSSLSEGQRAAMRLKTIGFVFQTFNLLPNLSALQNVALPLRLAGASRREQQTRARELLNAVELGERMKHSPAQLSGGERQRVAIARALANRPRIVLADEPTGNLDSRTGSEILGILKDLNRDGLTIVMVTHDQEISRQARRTVRLRDGRVSDD